MGNSYFQSGWDYFHIPGTVSSALTVAAICLVLVPLFAGVRVGPFEVPDMPPRKGRLVSVCGLILTLVALAGFQPWWRIPPADLSDCGLFSRHAGPELVLRFENEQIAEAAWQHTP